MSKELKFYITTDNFGDNFRSYDDRKLINQDYLIDINSNNIQNLKKKQDIIIDNLDILDNVPDLSGVYTKDEIDSKFENYTTTQDMYSYIADNYYDKLSIDTFLDLKLNISDYEYDKETTINSLIELNERLTTNESLASTNETNINNLDTRITTNETNIIDLESQVETNTGNINTINESLNKNLNEKLTSTNSGDFPKQLDDGIYVFGIDPVEGNLISVGNDKITCKENVEKLYVEMIFEATPLVETTLNIFASKNGDDYQMIATINVPLGTNIINYGTEIRDLIKGDELEFTIQINDSITIENTPTFNYYATGNENNNYITLSGDVISNYDDFPENGINIWKGEIEALKQIVNELTKKIDKL